jgi:hypothetical protein
MGCFATVAGWAVRREWLYLLLLCSAPLIEDVIPRIEFDLVWYQLVAASALGAFLRSCGLFVAILTPLPLAFALGRYRPYRVGSTAILGCVVAQHFVGTLRTMNALGGSFLSWWGPDATLYMMPPLAGLLSSLCVWYIGASLGARTRLRPPAIQPLSEP